MTLRIHSALAKAGLAMALATGSMTGVRADTETETPVTKVGEDAEASLSVEQILEGADRLHAIQSIPGSDLSDNPRLEGDPRTLGLSSAIEDYAVGAPPTMVTFVCERGNDGRFALEYYRGFARILVNGRIAEGPMTFVRDGIYRGFEGWVYVSDRTDLYFFLANERDSYSKLWPVWFFFRGGEPRLYCLAS